MLAKLNGFSLETAENGEEALTKLEALEEDPSIVFVDLSMPVMNGTEFLRQIRERGLATSSRIVVFSARDKISGLELDQSLTWLAKPFQLADVLEAINSRELH